MTDLIEYDVRTDEMLVNMGPQQPSTHGVGPPHHSSHGVLRLVLRTDGEVVREHDRITSLKDRYLSPSCAQFEA